ncbi:hypothetical protein CsSME_00008909 [Camellia sinensis var. sinensis]
MELIVSLHVEKLEMEYGILACHLLCCNNEFYRQFNTFLVALCRLQLLEMDELSEGYNIVGLSQVKNFISLVGPHAGTTSIPFCGYKRLNNFI